MTGPRLVLATDDPSLADRFVALRAELGVPETFEADVLAEAREAAAAGPEPAAGGSAPRDTLHR